MLPMLIDFTGKTVLVVGFGKVGKRKAKLFYSQGARVLVYDRQVTQVSPYESVEDPYTLPCPLFLVLVATSDPQANQAIATYYKAQGVLVNRADDGPRGDVMTMATVKRGPLEIGISSQGAPGVSLKVKQGLEAWLPQSLAGQVAGLIDERRRLIEEAKPGYEASIKALYNQVTLPAIGLEDKEMIKTIKLGTRGSKLA